MLPQIYITTTSLSGRWMIKEKLRIDCTLKCCTKLYFLNSTWTVPWTLNADFGSVSLSSASDWQRAHRAVFSRSQDLKYAFTQSDSPRTLIFRRTAWCNTDFFYFFSHRHAQFTCSQLHSDTFLLRTPALSWHPEGACWKYITYSSKAFSSLSLSSGAAP